jgi:prefoldin subunit 5
LQLQIDAGISSGMDHLATINASIDAINLALTELSGDITTINTTIIDIQNDITTINSTIVDIQTDITDIQTDITTINSSIVTIQAAIVDLEDAVGDGSVTLTGGVTGTGFVGTPFATTVATSLNNIPGPTGNVSMGFYRITNLLDPSLSQDAATKAYVDSGYATLAAITLNNVPIATGTVNINNQSLSNVNAINMGTPTGVIAFDGTTAAGLANAILFPNTAQIRRIVLWNNPLAPNNFEFSGFGTDSSANILYHSNTSASHLFYAGLTSSTQTLIATLSATTAAFSKPVSIDIGSSTSNALQFNNVVHRSKIVLYQTAANSFQVYAIGILGSTLVYNVDSTNSSHVFYAGTSSTTADEVFRIKGTGWASVSQGDGTFYSRVPSAHVRMTGNATTTSCTANVWVKAAGTTTAASGTVQFTTSTTNRLTFTGSDLSAACLGMVSASITLAISTAAATKVGIAVYKNGTLIQDSPMYGTTNASASTNSPVSLSLSGILVSLSPTDYVEVWVLSGSNTTMTVTNLNLSFTAT